MLPNAITPGPTTQIVAYFNGTIAVNKFDLMFHDTDDVKPMSSYVWNTNEATTQSAASPLFIGLAGMGKLVTDTVADAYFPIITDIELEYDCVSTTFEVGDYVTPAKQTGDLLEKGKVKKTTTANQRIGIVTRRYGSATTRVMVRFMSNIVRHTNA